MASEPTLNGSSSEGLTPAQKLMERHGGDVHNPTVEEVIDQDDIDHPPPSMAASTSEPTPAPTPAEPLSAKAAGKQPATDTPAPAASGASNRGGQAPLDTQSEELFPALGAPKSRAAAAPTPWSRKPAAVGKAANGGINGFVNGGAPPSSASSRTSTPTPGIQTSTSPSVGGLSLPGRHTERIQFAPSQLTPRQQLKKPMADILRDINKRSKAKVGMSQGAGGIVTFESTGPTSDVVRQALKEVASLLGSKQSVKVPVPLSVRPHIIGRQGANIQALSKKTGARIQVPKQDESEVVDEDDDSATIDVLIEGDAVAAEMARREIEELVNQRTSTVNTRLREIPPEFYPFLAGAHNSRVGAFEQGRDLKVQIPHYHTWSGQAPPQAAGPRQLPAFVPQAGFPIQIAGDRQAANEVRLQIEREVEQLRRQLISDQIAIERGRHQFIIGNKGTSLHDFLQETGCSVILPPDSEDSELLTIIGPADRLDDGINKIMDLASSMSMASVDIARQHQNAPLGAQTHARNLTRYLQQREAIKQLEQLYDARIVAQTTSGGPTAWEVYSRDGKNTMRARSDIMNLISGHPPARLTPVTVDPFYHEHLRQQAAQQVRDQFGVHVVVPEELDDADEILLVYEGPSAASEYELPRKQPSANEVREFEKALQEAQKHVLALISGQQEIVSRDVDAPVKFHDKIRRHVDRQQASLSSDQIPIQVLYGGPRSQAGRKAAAPSVSVRGPTDRADELVGSLLAFIKQEEQDELERGFTLSFDFPQKFANMLIGKKGENIKKLREEFDVDIQVNDGKVELKGPEAKANACKAHIIAMGKKLEDEATYVLKIKPQFHRELIGKSGGQVNRLQERYNVRINFPRSAAAAADDEAADSEAPQSRRAPQAADEVIVRGPSRGADQARDELLSLLQYVTDNSHEATISVAQAQIPSLIGTGGRELDALRLKTGAQIDVPGARDAADPSGRAEIKIKGSKKAVEDAKKELQDAAKVFDSTVTRTLDVEKKHHRTIIGAGGSNIRDIVVKAGGPDDRRELARMVRFPREAESEGSTTIRIEASESIADKIVAAIQAIVDNLENQTTEIVEVAPEKHSKLIGRGGDVRKKIEAQFNIQLDIPRQSVTGPDRAKVKVIGTPENVFKAKEHILAITKDEVKEGATVEVPIKYHHIIAGERGQFFRNLRNDHKVQVDHSGQRPPARPEALSARKAGGAMPLITDDTSAENISWTVHDLHSDAPEGTIPWVLSGPSAEDVAKAQKRVEAALAEAGKQNTTGFLILPDAQRSYRLVVGPGGAEINRIRKATNTKINVPNKDSNDEAIEISGSAEGVEEAKDIILGIVNGSRS
ncbi:hypothetical protein MBLNU459_g5749t1 [Dothideomycetes sp. NU459]